ncbi:hypothetical protein HD806DRAFT_543633 [Xylariaceae sp. AK1471]|nr:hypothetical protein HD806DRAFT_543633 [Xylariaceae sp. AK1471]
MAQALPHVQIVATDLTPPLQSDTLPNLQFLKQDADLDWSIGEFDFIHGRMLSSGIHDWPGFLTKAWEHLRPGGRLELLDVSHPFRAEDAEADRPDASPFIHFGQLANKAWTRAGLDYFATAKHAERLKKLGFIDIAEQEMRWPLGEWAPLESEKRLGSLTLMNFMSFLDSAGVSILSHGDFMGRNEAKMYVEAAKMDLQENSMTKRFYLTMKICTAMKQK